jgi:toxin ParE1/3/4
LAIADRESIFDYIAPENLDAALALDELVERKPALLGAHLEAGLVGRVRGTRELVAHRHFVLVYGTAPDRVRIFRVLNTSRQWPPSHPATKVRKRAKSTKPRRAPGKQPVVGRGHAAHFHDVRVDRSFRLIAHSGVENQTNR